MSKLVDSNWTLFIGVLCLIALISLSLYMPVTDKNEEEGIINGKTAILTMYYPDGTTEEFSFIYDNQYTDYNSGNYYSVYYYDMGFEKIKDIGVVLVGGGTVHYKGLEQDEYKVFSGTFTINKDSNSFEKYKQTIECDACGGERPLDNDNTVVCPSCGLEYLPFGTQ